MADLSNLKIKERSIWDTKIGNKNLENWFILKDEYGKYEKFQELSIRWLKKFNLENFENCRFGKFWKLSTWKIIKICSLENSKTLHFGKFEKFALWKIRKICNLENSKNLHFWKFQKT